MMLSPRQVREKNTGGRSGDYVAFVRHNRGCKERAARGTRRGGIKSRYPEIGSLDIAGAVMTRREKKDP